MENQYFEDANKPQPNEDDIIKRIKECEMVVDKLYNDPVWNVVLKDALRWVRELDSKWQDVGDEKMLQEMRVLKIAYRHVMDLPKKYKEDLEGLKQALDKENEIRKDYDE
jgi:hypothetical protein